MQNFFGGVCQEFEAKVSGSLSYLAQDLTQPLEMASWLAVLFIFCCLSLEKKLCISFHTTSSHLLCFPSCGKLCCSFFWYKYFLLVPKTLACEEWKTYGHQEIHGTSMAKQLTENLSLLQVLKSLLWFQFYLRFLGVVFLLVHRLPCHLLTFLHPTKAWCERKLEGISSVCWHYAKNLFWSAGYLDIVLSE